MSDTLQPLVFDHAPIRDAIDVNCKFCNRKYPFDSVDAEQVFAAAHPLQAGAARY